MSKSKLALGAAAGLFAGAYYLMGDSKNAKKHVKKLQGFAIKMKGEVVEKLEKAKQLSEPIYNQIVDDVSKKYKKIEAGKLNEVINDLKKQGKKIIKDVKSEVGDLQVATTKKVSEIKNKKTPAKTNLKTTSKTIVNKKDNSKTTVKTTKGKVKVNGKNMNVEAVSQVTTSNPNASRNEFVAEEVVIMKSE